MLPCPESEDGRHCPCWYMHIRCHDCGDTDFEPLEDDFLPMADEMAKAALAMARAAGCDCAPEIEVNEATVLGWAGLVVKLTHEGSCHVNRVHAAPTN